jgi:hypothetical protein
LNSEFNWWLLIVGLVAGAALVWLVLADSSRRDADIEDEEIPMEAAWIAAILREDGEEIEPQTADRILRLHRAYLAAPPPDGPARPGATSRETQREAHREPAIDWSTDVPGAADESSPDQLDALPPRRPKAAPPAD